MQRFIQQKCLRLKAYETEKEDNRLLTDEKDIRPTAADASEINDEWLTYALRSSILKDSEAITATACTEIGEGQGFAGSIYRINVEYNNDNDLPRSFILKLPIKDGKTKELILSVGNYYKEARFYREIAPETKIRIPRVYYSATDEDNGSFTILMEDLGDIRRPSVIEEMAIDDCRTAICCIADFHAQWWNHSILESEWLQPLNDSLDGESVIEMLERSFEAVLSINTDSTYLLKCMQSYAKAMKNLPEKLPLKKPLTLIHGDFHAGNMAFYDGALTLFDWQAVGKGSPVSDLANLFMLNLEPSTLRQHEDDLLRLYHESLLQQGIEDYSYKRMMADYREAMVISTGRLFSYIGTLDFNIPGGQESLDAFVGRINQIAKDHRQLPTFRVLPVVLWFLKLFERYRR
jgi:hypothetical protein